ncbi:hypothetical protein HDU98_004210 [Podochytrium sp. JEL0797]|nr:hypothetical protein HDU98_004210 [Podochytrium sp. JEL0797]
MTGDASTPAKRSADDAHEALSPAKKPRKTPAKTKKASAAATPITSFFARRDQDPFKSALVHFKNAKLVFKEKKMNVDKMPETISELNAFHEFKTSVLFPSLDSPSRSESSPSLLFTIPDFPVQFYPLLAKLVQDSDLPLEKLAREVRRQLFPEDEEEESDDDEEEGEDEDVEIREDGSGGDGDEKRGGSKSQALLSDTTISHAITNIAQRVNYGLTIRDHSPMSASLWRWESRTPSLHLGALAPRFATRTSTRVQAALDLVKVFVGLTEKEQRAIVADDALFDGWRSAVENVSDAATAAAAAEDPAVSMMEEDAVADPSPKTPSRKGKSGANTPVGSGLTKVQRREQKEMEKQAAARVKEEARVKKEQDRVAAVRAKEAAKEEVRKRKEEERVAAEKAKEEARQKKEDERAAKAEELRLKKVKSDEKKVDRSQMSLNSFVFKIKKDVPEQIAKAESTQDETLTAFHDRFPAFHVKSNATVAQHNRFWKPTPHTVPDEIAAQNSRNNHLQEFAHFLKSASKTYQTNLHTCRRARLHRSQTRLLLQQQTTAGLTTATPLAVSNYVQEMDEEEDAYKKYRHVKWRLLQFAEDLRPAYFGTWVKRSRVVTGKRPWRREEGGVLNYEVDSEAEWEEEEVGEECGSEGEEEDAGSICGGGGAGGREENEEMDDWMVPDGYLSEDEADTEEGVDSKVAKELPKKKIGPLVPVVVCFFDTAAKVEGIPDPVLEGYQVTWMIDEVPTIDPFTFRQPNTPSLSQIPTTPHSKHRSNNTPPGGGGGSQHKNSLAKALKSNSERHAFDESRMEELVNLIQGSVLPMNRLVEVVKEAFPSVTKVQLELKIRQVAEKKRVVGSEKQQWLIKHEFEHHCAPGSIPQRVSESSVAARETAAEGKRKAASKPAIVDPPTSPLPESPRHFVGAFSGESDGEEEGDGVVLDLVVEEGPWGEGEDVEMGEGREEEVWDGDWEIAPASQKKSLIHVASITSMSASDVCFLAKSQYDSAWTTASGSQPALDGCYQSVMNALVPYYAACTAPNNFFGFNSQTSLYPSPDAMQQYCQSAHQINLTIPPVVLPTPQPNPCFNPAYNTVYNSAASINNGCSQPVMDAMIPYYDDCLNDFFAFKTMNPQFDSPQSFQKFCFDTYAISLVISGNITGTVPTVTRTATVTSPTTVSPSAITSMASLQTTIVSSSSSSSSSSSTDSNSNSSSTANTPLIVGSILACALGIAVGVAAVFIWRFVQARGGVGKSAREFVILEAMETATPMPPPPPTHTESNAVAAAVVVGSMDREETGTDEIARIIRETRDRHGLPPSYA